MASPEAWLELLAMVKAGFEAAREGVEFLQAFRNHQREPDTIAESRRVSHVFSTYSDDEIRAASRRIDDCRKRFIREGSGEQRVLCVCSVLNDFRVGNGGVIPQIDYWPEYWEQLCARGGMASQLREPGA